jgi:hypothetical protein
VFLVEQSLNNPPPPPPPPGLSLLVVIYKVAFPRITPLGRLPNSSIYRSTKQYPEAEETPGVFVLRVDAPLLVSAAGRQLPRVPVWPHLSLAHMLSWHTLGSPCTPLTPLPPPHPPHPPLTVFQHRGHQGVCERRHQAGPRAGQAGRHPHPRSRRRPGARHR